MCVFERSERGGVAECQSCGGAAQKLLPVPFFRWCTPTQLAFSHSEKQFGFVVELVVHRCIILSFSGYGRCLFSPSDKTLCCFGVFYFL